MRYNGLALAAGLFCLATGVGCLPALPVNVGAGSESGSLGVVVREEPGARVIVEEAVGDAVWLEIDRTREPGVVGGYLSTNDDGRGALVILLHGASTFDDQGGAQNALRFHRGFGRVLQEQRYLTWSLAVRECGTAYGQGDLADALEAIDWLERIGSDVLGVQRVYLVGYSTGGTVATLVNRRRRLAAVVSLAGITQPDQFEAFWGFYDLLRNLYPDNIGMCQLGSTLDYYGPPGSPRWQELDTVDHLDELRSPMLFIHGTDDIIFLPDNTRNLQARYDERLAAGDDLPALEFEYLPGVGHLGLPDHPGVPERVLAFLAGFEP